MEGRLILKDCSLFRSDGRVRTGMAVVVEGRVITRVEGTEALPVRPGDWEVRCGGRLVLPALADCHANLVGGQLTPWSGDFWRQPFAQRFERERRVGLEVTVGEIEAITAWGLARGLRQGIGMHLELLLAPGCVEGALLAQARVAEQLGARLMNAHASMSGIEGHPGEEQAEANARHVEAQHSSELVRGGMGVRASFCADDGLLRAVGTAKETLSAGAHFALGESDEDLAITWERHGSRIAPRFERSGLLGGASVAVYGRAIDRQEAMSLAKSRTLLALTPRLNQILDGGSALSMEAVLVGQNLIGLGTSGTGALGAELSASFAGTMALARMGHVLDPDSMASSFVLGGPSELNTMLFGLPSGSVDPGAVADLMVSHLVPACDPGVPAPHVLMAAVEGPAAWTIVNGRVVVREGQLVGADATDLAREAAKAVTSVISRVGLFA